jgi:hypothetical protein
MIRLPKRECKETELQNDSIDAVNCMACCCSDGGTLTTGVGLISTSSIRDCAEGQCQCGSLKVAMVMWGALTPFCAVVNYLVLTSVVLFSFSLLHSILLDCPPLIRQSDTH